MNRSLFLCKKIQQQINYSTKKLQQKKFDLDQLRRTEAEIFDTVYKEKQIQQFHRDNLYMKKIYEEPNGSDLLKDILRETNPKNFYSKYDTEERKVLTEQLDTMQENLDPGRKQGRKGGNPSFVAVHSNYETFLEQQYALPDPEPTTAQIRQLEKFDLENPKYQDFGNDEFYEVFPENSLKLLEYVEEVDKFADDAENHIFLTKKQRMQRRARRSKRRQLHRRLENTIRAVAWHKKL
eukprot:gene527-8039_t